MTQDKGNAGEELADFCRALPGATEDVKWGNDLVFSIAGKMFACFELPDCERLSFKVEPLLFSSLVTQPCFEPAPYLARHSWVSLNDTHAVPVDALEDFLTESHRLVAAKLPKKAQQALGLVEIIR